MAGRRPNPFRVVTKTGHRPIPEPVVLSPGEPTIPESLDGKEDALRMWRNLTTILEASGVLDKTDEYALELTCLTYHEYRYAKDLFDANPETQGSMGQTVISPWYQVQLNARKDLLRQLSEFGLTPATRGKLAGLKPTGDATNDLGRMLA